LLAALVVESDPQVIATLVNAIGWQTAQFALEPVMAFASYPDGQVRSAVASGLAALVDVAAPDPRAVQLLKILSADADPEVRFDAWWALIEELPVAPHLMGDALRVALDDSDPQVREMAERHLALTEPVAPAAAPDAT
jgi:HEAT repeat protein